jgi:hypothetical protein
MRFRFFNTQRQDKAWVFALRDWLARLGGLGILLTAGATAANLWNADSDLDSALLVLAMLAYAAMAAIAFYENSTNLASGYFRQVAILVQSRDLWTNFQFAVLAEVRTGLAGDATADTAARDKILALAQAAWADMEALARSEQESWQGEVLASLSKLQQVADGGGASVKAEILRLDKLALAAATEAKDAKAALEQAQGPAFLTLTIEGAFTGEAEILMDGVAVARTETSPVALPAQRPGIRHLVVKAKGDGGKTRTATAHVELKAGRNAQTVALPEPAATRGAADGAA